MVNYSTIISETDRRGNSIRCEVKNARIQRISVPAAVDKDGKEMWRPNHGR